jgi:hypothetical protein
VTSLGELEYAIRENRLLSLPGHEKSQQRIDEGFPVRSMRVPAPEAWSSRGRTAALLSASAKPAGVEQVEIAGELRRGCETVSSITLVVACQRPEKLPAIPAKAGALPVTVDAGPKEDFGNRLLRATGSDAHLRDLEARDALGTLRSPSFEESVLYERLGWPPSSRAARRPRRSRARRKGSCRASSSRGLQGSSTSRPGPTAVTLERPGAPSWVRYVGITDHSPPRPMPEA